MASQLEEVCKQDEKRFPWESVQKRENFFLFLIFFNVFLNIFWDASELKLSKSLCVFV